MILSDSHVHTEFSSDSTESMEKMILKAIELGLESICFTDHLDYDYPNKYGYDFNLDVDSYMGRLEELKDKYQSKIKIRKGIELGLMPYLSDRYNELTSKYSFDYIIGSSHLIDKKDPYYEDFWTDMNERDGYEAYFRTIIDNIASGCDFDSYGHIDYVVRYGPNKNSKYTYETYSEILDEVLKTIIHSRKALEINTAGFKYGLGHFHPQTDVLKRYLELGGELITIGSDAHKKEHLAYDFDKTSDILKSMGLKYYVEFENRTPKICPL
ncbi:histidinol-phosphatase HisJ family protein [Anaeromicropila herbilytica]|uniref:Histidinol-phosphatase n=1 Tax=Anaeromicropila herbilytica TaxID=2785025 RepID=A0A7R7EN27_9FIRM|nr:histidinol-phosphatase HisJ family protein [Anaeromicropila herbilytica]BCN31595.1 phosphoesterase [Anaeromicropila herbilytica]